VRGAPVVVVVSFCFFRATGADVHDPMPGSRERQGSQGRGERKASELAAAGLQQGLV
jgi:hypothetical protein